jgi:hypothetical protein
MGVSHIVLVTAFHVDNGPHLPLWRELPAIAYWVVPALVGLPIMAYALMRHPRVRRSGLLISRWRSVTACASRVMPRCD